MRGSLTVDEEIFQDTLDRGDVVSIGPRSREIKGNGGMRRPVEQREEENKGGYNDNKNCLCGDKARDSNSETSLSLTLFLYIYKPFESLFLFERAFEFCAVIEQRLNRFNRFSNHRRFFGD